MPPMIVTDSASAESLKEVNVGSIELVSRNCHLQEYKKKVVNALNLSGDFIAFASPDSSYAVTKRLLDAAQKSILIGIYDFTAGYMKDILLNAMHRGVKVALMLDLDGVAGEKPIFDDLKKFGCEAVAAPSCASDAISFFPSSHEKVVVIDDTWTLVQSGNYSKNSIPLNEKDGGDPANFVTGNRDMGVAIRSKPLAKFFTKILRSDMKLETNAEGVEALHRAIRRKRAPDLVEAVPEALPPKLFPSKKFNPTSPIKVVPVLTPDNYMDVVPDFIKKAKKSILIEQQYIRGSHTRVITLLNAIRFAMDQNPNLDVRIILGKIFSQSDLQKEKANLDNIKKVFKLSLGTNIRFIDIKRFVHCHNKLVIVDNQAALVSSQNWSETGVGTNREAGLVIYYPDVARYFSNIFESDWSTALKTFPKIGGGSVGPESLARGNFMEVSAADYQEV